MSRLLELQKIPDIYAKALHYVFENNMVPDDGLWLEFGVHAGGTINRIAKYTTKTIYGFDSFEGLPQDWAGRIESNGVTYPKGTFSLGGWMPAVAPNVQLIKGWYNNVLPGFMAQHPEPIAFLHMDSDIYSSTKEIFNYTAKKIKNGCIIVFDELVGYTGFEQHEWKAWWEFVDTYKIDFEWIGGNASKEIRVSNKPAFDAGRPPTENISPSHENCAVRIINNPFYKI